MSFTKIKNLYIAINHVVAEIGKDGEIQRRSEFVEDLLTALHAIDQGEFKPGLFDRAQTKLETNAAQITQLQAEVEALRKDAEWIPVSERLPDDNAIYLVYFIRKITELSYIGQSMLTPALNAFYVAHDLNDAPMETVTHWKPLPKPPTAIAKDAQLDALGEMVKLSQEMGLYEHPLSK
jgi:Protein of unknown function (DUF551)